MLVLVFEAPASQVRGPVSYMPFPLLSGKACTARCFFGHLPLSSSLKHKPACVQLHSLMDVFGSFQARLRHLSLPEILSMESCLSSLKYSQADYAKSYSRPSEALVRIFARTFLFQSELLDLSHPSSAPALNDLSKMHE